MADRLFDDAYTEDFPELHTAPRRSCCASWVDTNHADDCTHEIAVRDIDLPAEPEVWEDELPAEVGEPTGHDIDGEELGGDLDSGD